MFLPARKPEVPIDEKPISFLATKGAKGGVPAPAPVTMTKIRAPADEIPDIYKTHPVFAATVEPIANQFMPVRELIEVSDRILGR